MAHCTPTVRKAAVKAIRLMAETVDEPIREAAQKLVRELEATP